MVSFKNFFEVFEKVKYNSFKEFSWIFFTFSDICMIVLSSFIPYFSIKNFNSFNL